MGRSNAALALYAAPLGAELIQQLREESRGHWRLASLLDGAA